MDYPLALFLAAVVVAALVDGVVVRSFVCV